MKVRAQNFDAIQWHAVASSNVLRVAWVPAGHPVARRKTPGPPVGSLYVEFRAGTIYHYDDVTKQEARELFDADSVGTHLNNFIKGVHPYEQVTVETTPSEGGTTA